MRILVAEDSVGNRELLVALLQSRGHSVTGVSNGREALAALEKETFEVIFMDEEMPGMGGIEATRALHANSAFVGKLPMIVGVSGNNSEEDEKRCLAAGMDAFLAKPIGMHDLFQVLDLLALPSQPSPLVPIASAADNSVSADLAAHLNRATGGNKTILQSLINNFLADTTGSLSVLRDAIAHGNADVLASAAHAFRGALGTVGALRAAAIAGNLQTIGRSGDLARAAAEFAALESEVESVQRELRAIQSAIPSTSKSPRQPAATPRRKS
jgi:two-component system, sensor histidine kinase and response regulator